MVVGLLLNSDVGTKLAGETLGMGPPLVRSPEALGQAL